MNEILLVGNPRRRKPGRPRKKATRRKKRTTVRRRNTHTRKRRVTRRRRNPARRVTAASIQRQITTASQGALGALGLDIALAYIPLPAAVTGPLMNPVIKGLGAIALGALAGMAGVRADTANRMTEGALTVQLHGIGKQLLSQFAPGVALSAYVDETGLGYYGSGWNPNVPDDPDWGAGMGTYLPDISADTVGMDETGFSAYADAGYGYDSFYGG